MLGKTVNEMTITRKLSRVDAINKEGACAMASQKRGIEISADNNGEKTGLSTGNQMMKVCGTK